MAAFLTTPGYVTPPPVVQQHVLVVSGNNWDLSRSAAATPLRELPPPPNPGVLLSSLPPQGPAETAYPRASGMQVVGRPTAVVQFYRNGDRLSYAYRSVLSSLPRGARVVLAGHCAESERHPDRLSLERVRAVASYLRRRGVTVVQQRNFSDDLPLYKPASDLRNARVEIFVLPK
jgi:hypothetical protein